MKCASRAVPAVPALQPSAFILRPYLGSGCRIRTPARQRAKAAVRLRLLPARPTAASTTCSASSLSPSASGPATSPRSCSGKQVPGVPVPARLRRRSPPRRGRAARGCGRSWASAPRTKIRELFQQGYRGSHYSFGCRLPGPGGAGQDRGTAQAPVHRRHPERELHARPGRAPDALVVHHPQAKYFDVRADG